MHSDMRDYKITGQVGEQHETAEFQVLIKRIQLTVNSESKDKRVGLNETRIVLKEKKQIFVYLDLLH